MNYLQNFGRFSALHCVRHLPLQFGAIQHCALWFVDGTHVLLQLRPNVHRIFREDGCQLRRAHRFAGVGIDGVGGDVLKSHGAVVDRELDALLALLADVFVLLVELLLVDLFDQAD